MYERTVCMLMLQCLKGTRYLHKSGFTHGNLSLNSLFLIQRGESFQLLLGNFGRSKPLTIDRRASALYSRIDDSPIESVGRRNDFLALADIFRAFLHQDENGNGTHASEGKVSYSKFSEHLRKASGRLRDGSASPRQVVAFLQALLWGPFKLDEDFVIMSESRMRQWLENQRAEFVARLAMDEAVARTAGRSRAFSMEDMLLCEYLTVASPSSLVLAEKSWFLPV